MKRIRSICASLWNRFRRRNEWGRCLILNEEDLRYWNKVAAPHKRYQPERKP